MKKFKSTTACLSGCFILALIVAIVNFALPLNAEEQVAPRTYDVHLTAAAVKVDGVLEEAIYKARPTFTLDYETYPGDNTPAPVKTEMWIMYDTSRLIVGVRAHDPNPEQIRARLQDRDKAYQDDFIGVVLDTFNDEHRGFEFFVNPLGVQMDLTQNDFTGNEDDSWDAIWESAGHVTSTGYEVELAIPFSSLRFPTANGPQIWGIDAMRIYPRSQRFRIGLNKLPRGRNCYLCNESKLQGFDGVKPGRNMELDPTLTGHRTDARDDVAQPFQKDQKADPGLSARWGITPGITVNGAINPDFSQVEADAAQLTVNTQFAIFYPEKRPFFLESADIFDTKIQAIYTRDIADPNWGIKFSGKEGKSAFGAILAQDDQTNFVFPGSQFSDLGSLKQTNVSGILRYRYDLFGSGASSVGGLITTREGDGYHNRVAGLDTLFRWGNEAVRAEALASSTAYPLSIQQEFNQPSGSLTGTSMRIAYEHSVRSWTGYLNYTGAGEDFRADLGFIPQVGYHKGYGFLEHYWFSDNNEHWWRKITLATESTWTYDRNGNPLQEQVAPYFSVNGPHEFFTNNYFPVGPSYYQGKRFSRTFVDSYNEMRPSGSVYVKLEVRVGQEIDYANAKPGKILRLIPGLRFDLARHLRLELNDTLERLNVDGGQLYRANVSELRATYQLTTRTFLRAITQYFDVRRNPDLYTFEIGKKDQQVFNQFLFSYKINPQVVLFLGYSDNYMNSPLSDLARANRTFFFKVGYAFVL